MQESTKNVVLRFVVLKLVGKEFSWFRIRVEYYMYIWSCIVFISFVFIDSVNVKVGTMLNIQVMHIKQSNE